ncbi:uncharacterized protein ARMOST_21319 [Armillaria ostoyae]|uniref:Transmembrane protein n=1 Tax=Armillaria ostoyae TaxID=47428 RepID=A0A284S9R6_ARMOS|nr:uncharacterized protein ARMOST_21319 [Armillaria ostoyae]
MLLCMGLLHHLVYFFVFSASVYKVAMLTTDISRRWVDPVLADVFTYGLPPANVTSVSLSDTLVQGVFTLLEPIVVEAISPVAVLAVDVYAYGVPRHTNDAEATVASLDGPLAQGVLAGLLTPIVVVESICPVAIPEPSVTLATVDYSPNQTFVQPRPTGLAPKVSPVPSNLTMVFVSSAFVVVVAAFALVLRRGSRSSQGGGVVEDIPLPDQTKQGTVSLWVLIVEPMINSTSLPSGDFPYSNIFDLSRVSVRVQCTFEICQAEDTSVSRESVSAQDILSFYVTVPVQSSISQKMVEELDGVYDVLDSIAFSMRLVISEDDLRTMASTISFPPVNDLARPTEFQKLCQAVFDGLAGGTQRMAPSLSLLSMTDLGSVPLDLRSGLLESTGGFERCDLNWSTLTREAWVRDFWHRFLSDPDLAKLAYRALLPADAPKTASTENVAEMSEALILSVPRSSSAQPSNSVLRFSSENPSPGDLEDEQPFESSAISSNEHSPYLTPTTPSSSVGWVLGGHAYSEGFALALADSGGLLAKAGVCPLGTGYGECSHLWTVLVPSFNPVRKSSTTSNGCTFIHLVVEAQPTKTLYPVPFPYCSADNALEGRKRDSYTYSTTLFGLFPILSSTKQLARNISERTEMTRIGAPGPTGSGACGWSPEEDWFADELSSPSSVPGR